MQVQHERPVDRSSQLGTSAGKALALLDAFISPRSVLGVSDLAMVAGLPKSTAYRLLNILVEAGYLQRVEDQYRLADHVFEVGSQAPMARAHGLRDRAIPFMAELFAQTRQTVHLAVLSGDDVLYLEKLFGHESVRLQTAVGRRRPAYSTALGKAMLAFAERDPAESSQRIRYRRYTAYTITSSALMSRSLLRAQSQGYATESEESVLGVACLAVPIFDGMQHRAIAAMSLSTSVGNGLAPRFKVLLTRAAEQLTAEMTPHKANVQPFPQVNPRR